MEPQNVEPDTLPRQGVFRLRGVAMTRLETFSDAAFAFALTLLVISLEPLSSVASLMSALQEIPAFIASGSLLMMFWWGHHQWSRRYGLEDGPAVVLTCVLVFVVLIYVVPLRFMFGLFFVWLGYITGLPLGSDRIEFTGPQDVNTMFLVYGLGFAAMAGSLVLLYAHAWRKRAAIGLSRVEAFETLAEAGIWAIVAGVGVLSAAIAYFLPPSLIGLPGWAYMLLPPLTGGCAHLTNKHRKRLEQSAESLP